MAPRQLHCDLSSLNGPKNPRIVQSHSEQTCRLSRQITWLTFHQPRLEVLVDENVITVHFEAVLIVDDDVLASLPTPN